MAVISQNLISVDTSTVCAPGQRARIPASRVITVTTSLGTVTGKLSDSASPAQLYFTGKSPEAKKLHAILGGASKTSPVSLTLDFTTGEE